MTSFGKRRLHETLQREFLLGALCLCLASGAVAQPSQNSGNRRDEFARVTEQLSDPDPLQRLANLEAVIKRGDPVLTQLALKIAFASDDRDLRGLAMRGLIATLQEVTFEVKLPQDVARDYEQSRNDPRQSQRFTAEHRYIGTYAQQGGRLRLVVTHYRFPEATGEAEVTRNYPAQFTVNGDRFASKLRSGYGTCYVEFAPTRSVSLEGQMQCEGAWPALALTARPL